MLSRLLTRPWLCIDKLLKWTQVLMRFLKKLHSCESLLCFGWKAPSHEKQHQLYQYDLDSNFVKWKKTFAFCVNQICENKYSERELRGDQFDQKRTKKLFQSEKIVCKVLMKVWPEVYSVRWKSDCFTIYSRD